MLKGPAEGRTARGARRRHTHTVTLTDDRDEQTSDRDSACPDDAPAIYDKDTNEILRAETRSKTARLGICAPVSDAAYAIHRKWPDARERRTYTSLHN